MPINFPLSILEFRKQILNQLGAAWQHYEADLDILLHLRSLGLEPGTIFDIGASNTVWSVLAHAIFPNARFELFEPLAEISDAYLHGKFTHPAVRNFLENADFKIHAIAIGDENGECNFQHFEGDAGSTSIEMGYTSDNSKKIRIPMSRLDDYTKINDINQPDLIKMDTQGAELDILKGGANSVRNAKIIFAECWLSKGYGNNTPLFLQLANALANLSFDLFDIGDEYRSQEGIAQTKDAVFINRTYELGSEFII